MSTLQLADLHLDSLYVHDSAGRMRTVNESAEPTPPRFHLVRTAEGNRWRMRGDLPTEVASRLDALASAEPAAADIDREPANAEAMREALRAHEAIAAEWQGPAFVVPAEVSPPESVTEIDRSNAGLSLPHFAWLADELEQSRPCFAVVVEGRAVSICCCARRPRRAVEAGVETIESARRRGYGKATVAAWASAVRESGRLPLYSTSWGNVASRGVARSLGMRMYGADWHVT